VRGVVSGKRTARRMSEYKRIQDQKGNGGLGGKGEFEGGKRMLNYKMRLFGLERLSK